MCSLHQDNQIYYMAAQASKMVGGRCQSSERPGPRLLQSQSQHVLLVRGVSGQPPCKRRGTAMLF